MHGSATLSSGQGVETAEIGEVLVLTEGSGPVVANHGHRFSRLLASVPILVLPFSSMPAFDPGNSTDMRNNGAISTTEVGKWICLVLPTVPGCKMK